ncbi:MAG TPA: winged helix-turn-helix transcriptional regulator [Solirubrobacterales bacterium]|nr:winged helix-turn-helix transcriptional regulator [Solirubrobacterales bacterium]
MTSREAELTTPGVLRLLGAGASGAIVMALKDGPLRTKELTERVRGYTPRTVYRYANRLTELGVIAREEEPGVPSKVVHSLTEPCGRELFELIDAYADASLTRLPNGEIDAHAWGSLGLLADLWESGMIEALNYGPRSPTELARGGHDLSYHQVNRRAGLFAIGGFLRETSATGRRRRYELTQKARRTMALVAGIGRWRRRYVVPEGTPGLEPREAGSVLRTALPLVSLPEHGGKGIGIEIAAEGMNGGGTDAVWASVEADGAILTHEERPPALDAHARSRVPHLIDALLDGSHKSIQVNGDCHLLETCLSRLNAVLWEKALDLSATPAEAVAGGSDGTELGDR